MGKMEIYEEDFENFMLQNTASYYSGKASSWIQEDSCPEYMLKSEEWLKKERERVTHYLHSSSEPKLVEVCYHTTRCNYASCCIFDQVSALILHLYLKCRTHC